MLDLRLVWLRDLPVCFPGRQCIDEPPLEAPLFTAIATGTPSSPAISAGCFVLLGASLVLIGLGLRLQWRESKARPWLTMAATCLLLIGIILTYVLNAWFGTISLVYSDLYGQPSAPVPVLLIGSWPSVLFAGHAMVVLAAVTLLLMLNTAALRRQRRTAD